MTTLRGLYFLSGKFGVLTRTIGVLTRTTLLIGKKCLQYFPIDRLEGQTFGLLLIFWGALVSDASQVLAIPWLKTS
jgi:hypothetical protein